MPSAENHVHTFAGREQSPSWPAWQLNWILGKLRIYAYAFVVCRGALFGIDSAWYVYVP